MVWCGQLIHFILSYLGYLGNYNGRYLFEYGMNIIRNYNRKIKYLKHENNR